MPRASAAWEKNLVASGVADGFAHSERRAKTDVAYGERTRFHTGQAELTETLELPRTPGGHDAPLRLQLGHASFFQINPATASKLYGEALLMALEALAGTEARASGGVWKAGEGRRLPLGSLLRRGRTGSDHGAPISSGCSGWRASPPP